MMDFTEVMNILRDASPYELYRLRAALKIEMENPEKINKLYHNFAIGDQLTYFNDKKNMLCKAIVLEKNIKYVVVKDLEDNTVWNTPYYAINITGQDSQIYARKSEKLTRNHLRVGETVGFIHDGKQIVGHIEKLNQKSVSLITCENKRWRVGYEWLFQILEGNQIQEINSQLLIEGTVETIR
jgi:hypothetical protein